MIPKRHLEKDLALYKEAQEKSFDKNMYNPVIRYIEMLIDLYDK
jgi:hypothetical protein